MSVNRRVDVESKQLAINRNMLKLKNESLTTSHLLTCFLDMCVRQGQSLYRVLYTFFGTMLGTLDSNSDF